MTEQFLHFCWKYSSLPFHQLKLADGESFSILKNGMYNENEAGPDFNNAKIVIDDLLWCGPVEIHIKSSDWYRHGHQNDSAYDNVILHVVYQNDCEVIQNGRKLPTLELKALITQDLIERYTKIFSSKSLILCKSSLATVPPIYFVDMIAKCSVERIERKVAYLDGMLNQEAHQVLYTLLAKSFGGQLNGVAFEELSFRIPFNTLKQIQRKKRTSALVYVSGLENYESSFNEEFSIVDIEVMASHSWKSKGVRPSSFPLTRLVQFGKLFNLIDFELLLRCHDIEHLSLYLGELFKSYNTHEKDTKKRISKNFQELLIINCFLPFLIWNNRKSNRAFAMESAIELLSLLRPEANSVVSTWSSLEIKAQNAFESQGLLELFQSHCSKRQCMTCSVGIKLMKE